MNCVEKEEMDKLIGLKQLGQTLLQKSEEIESIANETLGSLKQHILKGLSFKQIKSFIIDYIEKSTYSARIFEISIHALFQALQELKVLHGFLKPLSQMRSANKKHGNIGDIEVTTTEKSLSIIEAWDAKYGKTYFRDELEELRDKIPLPLK